MDQSDCIDVIDDALGKIGALANVMYHATATRLDENTLHQLADLQAIETLKARESVQRLLTIDTDNKSLVPAEA